MTDDQQRTLKLCKMVLDHLGSKLRGDFIVHPSLNDVAVLAAKIMDEIHNENNKEK